jgi:hypothetical protein
MIGYEKCARELEENITKIVERLVINQKENLER